jgi:hypothetical protein
VGYRLLTSVTVAVHFAFIGYVVLGGFLAWRWAWTIVPHALAAGWGLLILTVGVNCPLTAAENWSRQRSGAAPLVDGFIDRYLTGVIYPARYLHQVQALAVAVVVVSWLGMALRVRAAHR